MSHTSRAQTACKRADLLATAITTEALASGRKVQVRTTDAEVRLWGGRQRVELAVGASLPGYHRSDKDGTLWGVGFERKGDVLTLVHDGLLSERVIGKLMPWLNAVLLEYGAAFAADYATANGMTAQRLPENEAGEVLTILTGGQLLPQEQVHVTSRRDGTSTIAAVGFQGKRCKEATGPLEAALGSLWTTEFTADYYHDSAMQHLKERA